MKIEVNNLTKEKILSRYDAVFHLVTAAIGCEEFYNHGNEARSETVEEAKILDKKTRKTWLGHNHLRVIDNKTNFENFCQTKFIFPKQYILSCDILVFFLFQKH